MIGKRKQRTAILWTMLATMICTGCRPMQPYYLHETGDLSHYLDTATAIDYPDVDQCSLDEVTQAQDPITIRNADFESSWDLTLEEAMQISLQNSKIIRSFGQVRSFGQFVGQPPERLTLAPDATFSVYDVAIQESGQGGVEQILSNFDAIFRSQTTWESFDRPQNVAAANATLNPLVLQQDVVNVSNELSKLSASGAQFFMRNVNTYTGANNPETAAPRAVNSDWLATIEAEIRQPLARNRGTQINRVPVVLARIRTDVTLTQFEQSVMGLMNEVERAYWELYFFYHNLEAAKVGRNSALGIWRRIYAKYEAGAPGGEAEQEAQAREQYYAFRARVESELHNVLRLDTRLRYLMGLSPSDGRIIRPIDSPTTAQLTFDWHLISREALMRNPAIRQQRWRIKQRELELIAARNLLLPRIDAVALYRWLGVGDEFNKSRNPGTNFPAVGSTAVDSLLEGDNQEFRLGFEAEIPLGFRQPLAQVRNQQLLLAREKSRLEDTELEVLHQLDDAIKDLDAQYQLLQTNLNRLAAAQRQVESVEAAFDAGTVVLDLLLDSQRRRADAEAAFYQSLTLYNLSIVAIHLRKGSILEYNNVVLAEGPWPAKAYFDAENHARQRDASYALHYGYSRPSVISRGPVEDHVPPMTEPNVYAGNPYDYDATGADSKLDPTPAQQDGVDGGTDDEQTMDAEPLPPYDQDKRLSPPPAVPGEDGLPTPQPLERDQEQDDRLTPPTLEDENILEAQRTRRGSPPNSATTDPRPRRTPSGNVIRFAGEPVEPLEPPTFSLKPTAASVPFREAAASPSQRDISQEPPEPIQLKFR